MTEAARISSLRGLIRNLLRMDDFAQSRSYVRSLPLPTADNGSIVELTFRLECSRYFLRMFMLALPLALLATNQVDTTATPIVFPSASVAFESGIRACEWIYAGVLRGEKSDPSKPGPLSQRGFYMSGAGDEAKVDMLMPGRQAHVYKGSVKGGAGVVYIVLSLSPHACRVGSFDAPDSEVSALKHFAERSSGWVALPTSSPSPAAKMQQFQKPLAGALATLNLSWPVVQGTGPNGLAAMATMVIGRKPPTPLRYPSAKVDPS